MVTKNKKWGHIFYVKGPRLQKKMSKFVIEERITKNTSGRRGEGWRAAVEGSRSISMKIFLRHIRLAILKYFVLWAGVSERASEYAASRLISRSSVVFH